MGSFSDLFKCKDISTVNGLKSQISVLQNVNYQYREELTASNEKFRLLTKDNTNYIEQIVALKEDNARFVTQINDYKRLYEESIAELLDFKQSMIKFCTYKEMEENKVNKNG
jgi:hypothetical protein